MVATLIGTTVITALALVAVTAVRGDIPLTSHDLSSKKAYEAARAGVEDYASHLYADSLYWTKCTSVPEPNAVNLKGSTTKRRAVPGEPSETYAIELLPATGQTTYTQCSTTAPGPSMLETSGTAAGSFRIRVDRLRRRHLRSRSSPPSSGRASSTTSTSPSWRRSTRSPTATPTPRPR